VLEDLGKISKGKAKRYVKKSQWAFYQLETLIKYKAALLGVPILYINPAYTSQECSRCGSINKPNGKQYNCDCGHFDHRDANAAFNISAKATMLNASIYGQTAGDRVPTVGHIGIPLNWRTEMAVQSELPGGVR
jgi:putative transposase